MFIFQNQLLLQDDAVRFENSNVYYFVGDMNQFKGRKVEILVVAL